MKVTILEVKCGNCMSGGGAGETQTMTLSNDYTLNLSGKTSKNNDTLRYHGRPTKSDLFWVTLSIVLLKSLL